MPIKSSFCPAEALQGQDLPSHITWSDLKFDSLKIVHSRAFTLAEVYNVSDEDLVKEEDHVSVKRTKTEGYIGLVFSSRILDEKASYEKIEYSFILDEKAIENLSFRVYLFRPDVVVRDVPREIHVNPASGEVSPRIAVGNLGEGTAIIDIMTTSDSALVKHSSQLMVDFSHEFNQRVTSSIEKLKADFKDYRSLLEKMQRLITSPIEFEEHGVQMLKDTENEFRLAVQENRDFGQTLGEMLVETLLRTSKFFNVYQFVLDYINSLGRGKMIVRDPFSVISLSREPAVLRVEVKCLDLLSRLCSGMTLPPISVSSNEPGEIALFKLFNWGEEEK